MMLETNIARNEWLGAACVDLRPFLEPIRGTLPAPWRALRRARVPG
jgi:hypothetical protein